MNAVPDLVLQYPVAGLFALLILGGIGLPFPEDATLILCGVLISQEIIPPVRALVVVYLGLLSADTIVYLIGMKYGRMIVTHPRFHRFLPPKKFAELEDRFGNKGVWFILAGRHLVGLRIQIFLVAGVMRMKYLKFILADAVSSLFTLSIMVGIGYVGGNSYEIIRKDVTRVEHAAIVLGLAALSIFLLVRYFRQRREAS
jgi:membrane protein DedA with SNARE-associated domain